MIEQLVALGETALDDQGISWADANYVGIACPGQIDRRVPDERSTSGMFTLPFDSMRHHT